MKNAVLLTGLLCLSFLARADMLECHVFTSFYGETNFQRDQQSTSEFKLIPGSTVAHEARLNFISVTKDIDVYVRAEIRPQKSLSLTVMDKSTGQTASTGGLVEQSVLNFTFSQRPAAAGLQNQISIYCSIKKI